MFNRLTKFERVVTMEKRKIYVFITKSMGTIGGMQLYVAGKTKYLENLGWQIYILTPVPKDTVPSIPSVEKYLKIGGSCAFLEIPPYKFKNLEKVYLLNLLADKLGTQNGDNCEIIIETFDKSFAGWGELLAHKVQGRHFFVWLHEYFHPDYYGEDFDFFYFKWKRNEFISSEYALKKFFNGYKNVTAPLVKIPDTIREMDSIQDVNFPADKILKLDWNICHIGRIIKTYVPYLIQGVGELARRHPDKKIHFIMVGDATERIDFIKKTFQNLPNIAITLLGDLVPIPRILFSKVDVVCAISQTARFSANEGVLTILGSAKNPERTPGVLGYDTNDQVFGEPTFSYVDGKEYSLPKLEPAEKAYENFWTIVKNAAPNKEYFIQRLTQERIRNWTAVFPFGIIGRGTRIILFGETEIAKDYRSQIESQKNSPLEFGEDYVKQLKIKPYCQIVATVDEHPEEFDNEVVGVERLKQKDYDAIVITTFPQNAQSAYNAIVKTVPEIANRVVYNLKIVPI